MQLCDSLQGIRISNPSPVFFVSLLDSFPPHLPLVATPRWGPVSRGGGGGGREGNRNQFACVSVFAFAFVVVSG